MIQGDEPMVYPQMIDLSLKPLRSKGKVKVVNLMAPIETAKELEDRNTIKVVTDRQGRALYFSREAIPTRVRVKGQLSFFKQVCIIPYRREFLLKFNSWQQTPLEIAESIDMLRVLENGEDVQMVLTPFQTYSVDTPQDLIRVHKKMKKDLLFRKYKG